MPTDSIKIEFWNFDLVIQTRLSMKFHRVSKIGGICNPQK